MERNPAGPGTAGSGRGPVTVALALLLVAVSTVPGQARQDDQERRPVFEAKVDLAQIQVRVVDENGEFIPNLSLEDFSVEIDGETRRIASIYPIDLNTGFEEQLPESGPPPAAWRQFLLFFDLSFASPRGILWARNAALQFLDVRVRPTDLVAVATFSQLDGIRLLTPFSHDRSQVYRFIESLGLRDSTNVVDPAGFVFEPLEDQLAGELPGSVDAPVSGAGGAAQIDEIVEEHLRSVTLQGNRLDEQRYASIVVGFIDQMTRFARTLRAIRGRKHMILFSEGFADRILSGASLDEMAEQSRRANETGAVWEVGRNRFGQYNLRPQLDEALELMEASDTVIHAFDIAGLRSSGGDVSTRASRGFQSDFDRSGGKITLNYLSEKTGGTVHWNTNKIAEALAELEADTRTYYVVSYYVEPGDDSRSELDVEVDRPAARVSAPKRFARPPDYTDMDPVQRQLQLAEFVAKQFDVQPIAFNLEAEPFAGRRGVARVAVLFEIPIDEFEGLMEMRGGDKVELDFFGYITDGEGRMRDFFTRTIRVDRGMMDSARSQGSRVIRYYDMLWATAGDYELRGIVREAIVGQLSSRTVRGMVPEFRDADLAVAGPVFLPVSESGISIRGFDPSSPPERRAGGPVDYPFVVGGEELMPDVAPALSSGERFRVYLVAYHFARDEETGAPSAGVELLVTDPMGTPHAVPGVSLVGQSYDPDEDAYQMVFEGHLPRTVSVGRCELWVRVVDDLAGKTVSGNVPFSVGGVPSGE